METPDFGKDYIPVFFCKLLFPTLIGMAATALIVVIGNMFVVGHGMGSEGLAAVNIAAPLLMIFTGLGLMFGIGASVVVSIHLAKNDKEAACVSFTRSILFSTALMIGISVFLFVFTRPMAYLLEALDKLLPLVLPYMYWIIPFPCAA